MSGRRFVDPMILPAVAVIGAVIGYPIYRAISLSLEHYNFASALPPTGVGATNYDQLLHDPVFWQSLENSVIYAAGSVVCAGAIGLLLALATEGLKGRWRYLRTVLLTPWAVPLIVVAFLFTYMLNQDGGVVNAVLMDLGIVHSGVPWLDSSTWAMTSVIAATVWTQTPFFLLVFTAALSGVPNEVLESARVDRASRRATFFYVKLPYLRNPALIAGLIMTISAFNNFTTIWSMTSGGPAYSTTTLVIYVYRLAFSAYNMGYASAVGVVWLLLLTLFALFYIRLLRRSGA